MHGPVLPALNAGRRNLLKASFAGLGSIGLGTLPAHLGFRLVLDLPG